MHRLEIQLFFTRIALILSWLIFCGFCVYSWNKLNSIQKFSVTYDCALADQVETTPIEVRYKCNKLKEKYEKTGS